MPAPEPAMPGTPQSEVTVTVEKFLCQIARARQATTVAGYRQELNKWALWCQAVGAGTVEAAARQWGDYWAFRCARSAKSCWRKNAQTHRNFWQWAVGQKLTSASPVKVPFMPAKVQKMRQPPDEGEFKKFLVAAYPPTKKSRCEQALVEMLVSSGARLSEILELKIANLELKEGKARVVVKGGAIGEVRFSREAREAIQDWLENGRPLVATKESPDNVLLTIHGRKIDRSHASNILQRRCQKRGLKNITAHQLRHRFATKLLEAGASLPEVQRLMNHTKMASTLVYLHTSEAQISQAHAKLKDVRKSKDFPKAPNDGPRDAPSGQGKPTPSVVVAARAQSGVTTTARDTGAERQKAGDYLAEMEWL